MKRLPDAAIFDAMIHAVTGEARRIEAVQAALVTAGHRREPDPRQLRRARLFDLAAEMLAFLREHGRAAA
jgi:hypothetical protein